MKNSLFETSLWILSSFLFNIFDASVNQMNFLGLSQQLHRFQLWKATFKIIWSDDWWHKWLLPTWRTPFLHVWLLDFLQSKMLANTIITKWRMEKSRMHFVADVGVVFTVLVIPKHENQTCINDQWFGYLNVCAKHHIWF